jgi:hypothetical protein
MQHILRSARVLCVERKGSHEPERIELPPALPRPLAFITKKSSRIDYETKLTLIGGERRGAFETGLVHEVDRRSGRAITFIETRGREHSARERHDIQICCSWRAGCKGAQARGIHS